MAKINEHGLLPKVHIIVVWSSSLDKQGGNGGSVAYTWNGRTLCEGGVQNDAAL